MMPATVPGWRWCWLLSTAQGWAVVSPQGKRLYGQTITSRGTRFVVCVNTEAEAQGIVDVWIKN